MKRRFEKTLASALLISWLSACTTPDGKPASENDLGAGNSPGKEAAEAWLAERPEAETGLSFRHETGATGELHLPEIMGSGVAVVDLDGDGHLDLYLVNGGMDPAEGTDSEVTDRAYRQTADGTFEDVTEASGLGEAGYGMGVAVGDVDNDGDEDIYVANLGTDALYRNRGDGTFEDVTEEAGAGVEGWSSSAAFFDFDQDGHLDLFIARYVAYDPDNKCYDQAGRREYCGPTAFPGIHDVLLRNRGDGTFEDVTEAAGLRAVEHAGLGLVVRDFDGDGRSDVYVANDADPNDLWINSGDGTFREQGLLMGASLNALGQPEAGMGVLAEDLDGDLDMDLFVTHLGAESNTFYRNLGGGTGFDDATATSGLGPSSISFTGFGTAAFDADLDGDLDLAAANGRVYRDEILQPAELSPPWDAYAEPNLFYIGEGGGRFQLAQAQGGDFTRRIEVTRGLALGDLDGDGDLDLVTSNAQGPARIYRNDAPREGHWLVVDPWDPRHQRRALGAEVIVTAGERRWLRTVSGAASYQSAHDSRVHLGLGSAESFAGIEVRWPDGLRETFPGGNGNRVVRLERGTGMEP